MSLNTNVTYQPFQEISFGYSNTEITDLTNIGGASTFPNPTDLVKVEIIHYTGNFNETGHISTPSSGTTTSAIVKADLGSSSSLTTVYEIWTAEGPRSEVDEILAQIIFFPADYPPSRPYHAVDNPAGWRNDLDTYIWKENVSSGVYASENPPGITQTGFYVKVYDPSDDYKNTHIGIATFLPEQPNIENQRPYFSVEHIGNMGNLPGSYISAGVIGGTYDFGKLAHGSDPEHVTVILETYEYDVNGIEDTTPPMLGNLRVRGYDETYVGDKIPNNNITAPVIFEFTGELHEAQSFLDNVRLTASDFAPTMQTRLRVTDGDIGSYVDRVTWFEKDLVANVDWPETISASEETDVVLSNPSLQFTNLNQMPEVDEYSATITLHADAQAAVLSAWTNSTKTVPVTLPTETFTSSSLSLVLNYIEGMCLQLVPDFTGEFTIDIEYKAFNTSVGSEYTYTKTITVDVTDVVEFEFTNPGNITWYQNTPTTFGSGLVITDNALGGSAEYEVWIEAHYFKDDGDAGGALTGTDTYSPWGITLSTEDTDVTQTWNDLGRYKRLTFSGTRSQINNALANLTLTPAVDYVKEGNIDPDASDTYFWLKFACKRTTYPAFQIDFYDPNFVSVEWGIPVPKYTGNQNPVWLDWEKNMPATWDSDVQITDNAYDGVTNPANGVSDYIVRIKPMYRRDLGGGIIGFDTLSEVTLGTTAPNVTITPSHNNEIIIQGSIDDCNVALSQFTMTPDVGFTQPADAEDAYFIVDIQISRVIDGIDILEYPWAPASIINWGTDADAFLLEPTTYFLEPAAGQTAETIADLNTPSFQLRQFGSYTYKLVFYLSSTEIIPHRNGVDIGIYPDASTLYVDADYVDAGYFDNFFSFEITHINPTTVNQMLSEVYFEGAILGNEVIMQYEVFRDGVCIQSGSTDVINLVGATDFVLETRDTGYPMNDPNSLNSAFHDYQAFVDEDIVTDTYDYNVVKYSLDVNADANDLSIYNPEGAWIQKSSWKDSNENESLDNTDGLYSVRYNTNGITHDTANNRFLLYGDTTRQDKDMYGYWEEMRVRVEYDVPMINNNPVFEVTDKRFVTKITRHSQASTTHDRTFTQFIPNLSTSKIETVRLRDSNGFMQVSWPGNYAGSYHPGPYTDNGGGTHKYGSWPAWNLDNFANGGLLTRKGDLGIVVGSHSHNSFFDAPVVLPFADFGGPRSGQDHFLSITNQPVEEDDYFINSSTSGHLGGYRWEQAEYNANNTVIWVHTTSGKNSWTQAQISIGDVLVDENFDKVYVSTISQDATKYGLVVQDLNSTSSVDTTVPVREMENKISVPSWRLGATKSHTLGRLPDGTIVTCRGDSTIQSFIFTHYDPATNAVTGTYGVNRIAQGWNTFGSGFNTFFSQNPNDTPWCQLNLNGYALLGAYLYKFTGTGWSAVGTYDNANQVNNSTALENNTVLGSNVFCMNGGEFRRIGHPNGDADTVYGTGVFPDDPALVLGHRRGNTFVSTKYIYRFAE
jgi:hypothetical protein